MTLKATLLQVRRLQKEIDTLDSLLKQTEEDLRTLRASWPDGQPHGSGDTSDPVGSQVSQVIDTIQEIEAKIRSRRSLLWSRRMHVITMIGMVQDVTLYQILKSRYIDGDSFEQIAVALGYSYRHTIRLHGEALQTLENALVSCSC